LDRIINQAVSKIFNTFDQNDVHFIRAVVNLDDARAIVQRRQATFVSKFKEKSLYFAKYVVFSCYMVDILPLFNRLSSSF
jgi:CMP-2-keto-3-deoxyoctulosonic acid synthetase